ncbi:hypothetical protein BJX62DRAFT_244796 [Aspergillus germanicus]
MSQITRDRAMEIISEIYNLSGGFLTADGREGALAGALGAPVREAAAKACTADKRFFYEMIQNAEDCSYEIATSQGHDPFLAFYMCMDRIVVESNEDGFEESDVRAICSARSQHKQGKIGEKGISFKSVFKVASKVQIQSGPFCFSLRHREGEPGLGMVSPVNERHEDLPPDVRTRFTLSLLYPGQYKDLAAEVANFPVSITAFLSNLKKLRFSVHMHPSEDWQRQTFTRILTGSKLICIRDSNGKVEEREEYFYFSKQVTGTMSRENRPPSQDTEIIMAFPYDQRQENEEHFTHAYLPLRTGGLNFLVQADFVTQDDREVLADCPWNDHLLNHLPEVFLAAVKALSKMLEFDTSWLRFLPKSGIDNPQGSKFHEALKKELRKMLVFKTTRGKRYRSLDEVQYLLPEHFYRVGEPLFDDGKHDAYLSSEYAEYYKVLESFGLQQISAREVLDQLRPCLVHEQRGLFSDDNVCSPPIFHKAVYPGWHNKVALLLLAWIEGPDDGVAKEIGDLPLVPVGRRLRSPKTWPIYSPYDTKGNTLPPGLLDTVNLSAINSEARILLFTKLGVRVAEPPFIINRIGDENAWSQPSLRPCLYLAMEHLKYVFSVTPDPSMVDPRCILLYDSDRKALEIPHRQGNEMVRQDDVYLMDEHKYGIAAILRRIPKYEVRVRYLHPAYTSGFWFSRQGARWIQWLQEVGPVRRAPRLESSFRDQPDAPGVPSLIMMEITYSAPGMLISILKAHWDVYARELANASAHTLSDIADVQVAVACGTEVLEKAFLATPVKEHVWADEYLENRFPFLTIPPDAENPDPASWEFLSQFGLNTSTETFLTESARRLSLILPRRHAKPGFFKMYEVLADNYFEDFCDMLDVIKELTGCDMEADDFEPLKLCRFLPIRRSPTITTYGSVDEKFLIIDDDRVQVHPEEPVLDFMPEDVCRLRGFFSALGLEERFVSRQLESVTYPVSNAQESAELTSELRQKSEALYRIALHYRNRLCVLAPEEIRQTFSQAVVYTATGFHRRFSLGDWPLHQVLSETEHPGRLHVEYHGEVLKIYVPSDERERKISYATELPRELVDFLAIDDGAARGMFAAVLREPVDILDNILQEEGILRPALDPVCELAPQPEEGHKPYKQACNQEKNAASMSQAQQSQQIVFQACVHREKAMDLYEVNLMLSRPSRAAKRAYTGPSYLTTLSKKYSLADLDIDQDIPAIATDFFQVRSGEGQGALAETTFRAAATDRSSETMALLTKYLEERHLGVVISESNIKFAAENEECGDYIVQLLLSYSRARDLSVDITDEVLEAAARNEPCGDQIMDLLLDYKAGQCDEQQIRVPADVLMAALENTEFGDTILTLLLEHSALSNEPIHITENLLIAALENEDLCDRILTVILGHGCRIPVSLPVLAAAAANLHHGPELIRRLLVRVGTNAWITDDVLVAAVHNEISGLEVLKVLKQHNGGDLPLTEPILVAIVAQEAVDELIKLWPINLDDEKALVTQAVLTNATKNPACSKDNLERLLRAADGHFGVETAVLTSTMGDTEKATFLLNHINIPKQSAPIFPVRVLAAAAASLDCCLDKAILLKLLPGDMLIPSDVLEAAAGNPIHGYDVTKLLLEHCRQNLPVSEGVLLVAATNLEHGAGILQLLFERQPEAEVTDTPIAAAAAAGNGTLQALIRQREKFSLPPFEVTEGLLFGKFILQPLRSLQLDEPTTTVIVIDALDECDREDDIDVILRLLFTLQYIPCVRLRIFLTSRPELPIRLGFKQNDKESDNHKTLVLHGLPKPDIERDIRRFLEHRFSTIRQDRLLDLDWPGTAAIDELVGMAVPLFIFAATVCRLSERGDGTRQRDLQHFLETRRPHALIEQFHDIVESVILLASPLSANALAKLLHLPEEAVAIRLEGLHSVLSVPKDKNMPVRLLHLSFGDFLLSTTSEFHIDKEKTHCSVATKCLRLMRQGLRRNMCGLSNYAVERRDIKIDAINTYLPVELQYSCRHWIHHLQ